MEDTISTIFLLAVFGAIAYAFVMNRGGTDTTSTSRAVDEAIRLAATSIPRGTASLRSSWMPAGRSDTSITYTYNRRASVIVALFLLFLGIVPGVIYLIFGGKSQSVHVDAFPDPATGGTAVTVHSSGAVARRRARAFLTALGATATSGASAGSASVASVPTGVTTGLSRVR